MLGDIYWNPENIRMVKLHHNTVEFPNVYTRRTNDQAVCLAVLFFYVLPRHTNIMTDKGFNLFDECAARCVHLFLQGEGCASFSWWDTKMYTSGRIANSQTMLTEINESGAITKNKDFGGKWYCQTLKAFIIISSKMKISLILSW